MCRPTYLMMAHVESWFSSAHSLHETSDVTRDNLVYKRIISYGSLEFQTKSRSNDEESAATAILTQNCTPAQPNVNDETTERKTTPDVGVPEHIKNNSKIEMRNKNRAIRTRNRQRQNL